MHCDINHIEPELRKHTAKILITAGNKLTDLLSYGIQVVKNV